MSLIESSPVKSLAPFLIEPRYVNRVWGYRDLRPWYDRAAGEDGSDPAKAEPIGEVWLTGDDCRVATGPHAGSSLGELFAANPELMIGANPASAESPLLVKVIFAREKLSVQVHPDDRLAQKYGQPRGKTECWYALSAEPGAEVAAGVKPGVTMDQVKAGISDGTLEQCLTILPIEQGDMVFVDAGTVHAIWPGSILLETQQNCDLTYRMYDYGRPRELHIERSLEATRLHTRAGKVPPRTLPDRTVLVDAEYFCVERMHVTGERGSETLPGVDEAKYGLAYLFAASGSARLSGDEVESFEIPARGIAAIPASSPPFGITDLGGLDLIRISPRWPAKA